MDYFGKNTVEQTILDFLEVQKDNRGLNTNELIGKVNKVVEYYRESLMYEFDETDYPSTLEMMRSDTIKERDE